MKKKNRRKKKEKKKESFVWLTRPIVNVFYLHHLGVDSPPEKVARTLCGRLTVFQTPWTEIRVLGAVSHWKSKERHSFQIKNYSAKYWSKFSDETGGGLQVKATVAGGGLLFAAGKHCLPELLSSCVGQRDTGKQI